MERYRYSFFNTIELTDQDLKDKMQNASTQNERVFVIFMIKGIAMTPFEVHKEYNRIYKASARSPYTVPLTSIRRAITTLTNHGMLVKLKSMSDGGFGVKNYKWIINKTPENVQ